MEILIDRVRITNYRAIKDLELTLSPFTILVGANNSGKTTFLRALHLALGEGRKSISKEDFHIDNTKVADEIIIDVRIIPVDKENKRLQEFDEVWFPGLFIESQIQYDKNEMAYVSFRTRIKPDERKSGGYSIERTILSEWDESKDYPNKKIETNTLTRFEPIPLYFVDAQRDILQDIRDKNSFFGRLVAQINFDEKKVKELEKLLANLNQEIINNSPVLRHLSERLAELNETIGTKNSNIEITPVHKKIRDIGRGLNIHLKEQHLESLPLDYHGIGTRSWASLLALKAFISWSILVSKKNEEPFHPILALEEPESHLHPNAQRHLISQLVKMEGQKIVSTHSPFIVATCPLSSIRHFYKTENGIKIGMPGKLLSPKEMKKIEREIINTRGELLFAKCIVLCEGSTEEQMLPIFAKKKWEQSSFELGICFAGTGGGTNYKSFITFCRSLNIPWFILGDSEPKIVSVLNKHLSDLQLQSYDKYDNIILIPNGENIEQYLINQGYQQELKIAIFEAEKENCKNKNHAKAKEKEIQEYNDTQILDYLKNNKTKLATYIAEAIVTCGVETRRIPDVFQKLFDKIQKEIGVNKQEVNE
ncbi:MAG: AAA family ATPase [Planctomycetaceae bacterium]|jgi:putative ATP-dependent endonuclease of OLD family|nr:AAA family ATPase [Planctomycetaceae bacterium]